MMKGACRLFFVGWAALLLIGCGGETGDNVHTESLSAASAAHYRENTPSEVTITADTEVKEKTKESSQNENKVVSDNTEELAGDADPEMESADEEESEVAVSDTVKYVESERKEIMETRTVEMPVDPEDSSTYRIVYRTAEPVIEEIPVEYKSKDGKTMYVLSKDSWKTYTYQTVGVTLYGKRDDDRARFIADISLTDKGFTLASVSCERKREASGEYSFHYKFLYTKNLEGETIPENLELLTVSKTVKRVIHSSEVVAEKVPRTTTEEVGTGKYIYYGWQTLDGKTYYFDEHGVKVTGKQIIQGVSYEFDSDGILLK